MCYIHWVLHINVFRKLFYDVFTFCTAYIQIHERENHLVNEIYLIHVNLPVFCQLYQFSWLFKSWKLSSLYYSIEYIQLHRYINAMTPDNWRRHNRVIKYLALKLFIQTYACYLCSRSWFRWPYTHHRGQPTTKPGRSRYPGPCGRIHWHSNCFL